MPLKTLAFKTFNQYEMCDKAPFVIYADLECVIKKTDGCKNNRENLSTTKINEHIPSSFSMSKMSSFRSIENKHNVYTGEYCLEKFCEYLKSKQRK